MSAVLSNMIGASQVLYAIANDKIFGKDSLLTQYLTYKNQRGSTLGSILFTFMLVNCFLLLGNLNAVAPIVTTFFLMAYSAVDGACLTLLVTSAPNFRPTFVYFNSMTCLIGLVGTLFMMVLVSPAYAFFSCCIFSILFVSTHMISNSTRSENNDAWGHISQALIYHQVRKYLLMLDSKKDHVKYWRPQILILEKNFENESQRNLIFANDLKKSGLLVVGYITPKIQNLTAKFDKIRTQIDHMKIKAFLEVTRSNCIVEGSESLLRLGGLGGMKPNILMIGFPENLVFGPKKLNLEPENCENLERPLEMQNLDQFHEILTTTLNLQKNLVIYRDLESLVKKQNGFIDIYPFTFALTQIQSEFYSDLSACNFHEFECLLDNCSLFILQMGCILSLSANYKKFGINGDFGENYV